ncbi:MAG: hypothetical protein HUU38_01825, partial [Anaerolineales bacterium]|nr:hypothetical protein [Anaerolineales bacterium]
NAPTTISVTSPNGGEQWDRQLPHLITWTDNLGGEVNITLYQNGVYQTMLASNTASEGTYLWTPDAALTPGSGYTLRVTSVTNPALYDESAAPFTLTDAPFIARDDLGMTSLNTPLTLNVLGNDGSPGDALTITSFLQPSHGTVNLVEAHLVYTPTLDFLGTDVFTYTASTSAEQAEATVTVQVVTEVLRVFLPLIQR